MSRQAWRQKAGKALGRHRRVPSGGSPTERFQQVPAGSSKLQPGARARQGARATQCAEQL
eukprot:8132191-Alexandrium_andersonii.AAC.1